MSTHAYFLLIDSLGFLLTIVAPAAYFLWQDRSPRRR